MWAQGSLSSCLATHASKLLAEEVALAEETQQLHQLPRRPLLPWPCRRSHLDAKNTAREHIFKFRHYPPRGPPRFPNPHYRGKFLPRLILGVLNPPLVFNSVVRQWPRDVVPPIVSTHSVTFDLQPLTGGRFVLLNELVHHAPSAQVRAVCGTSTYRGSWLKACLPFVHMHLEGDQHGVRICVSWMNIFIPACRPIRACWIAFGWVCVGRLDSGVVRRLSLVFRRQASVSLELCRGRERTRCCSS